MDNSSWLIEKKYHELKDIAHAAMDREATARLKANAYLIMGNYSEFAAESKKLAKDNAYTRKAIKKVDLCKFLKHNEKKRAELSRLNKKILYKLWLRTDLTDDIRLRVVSIN